MLLLVCLTEHCSNQSCADNPYRLVTEQKDRSLFAFFQLQIEPVICCSMSRCIVWIITLWKPSCLCFVPNMSAVLFLCFAETRNQFGLQQALRQSGRQEGRRLLNRTNSQPYIWIRSTGWALMASLWNLKHQHRPERSSWGKSEYQQPFRSACTCSLHVTAPFSSPTLTVREPSQGWFIRLYYVLSGEHCWLLSAIQLGFCWEWFVEGWNMV